MKAKISINESKTKLSQKQLGELSIIHKQELTFSYLSSFPDRIIKNYYKFINESKSEKLFLLLNEDKICGMFVISFSPQTLGFRFISRNFFSFMFRVFELVNIYLLQRNDIHPYNIYLIPEIVQIAIQKQYQGIGEGKRLLNFIKNYFKMKNISRYYVKHKKLIKSNEKLERFYLNNKFFKICSENSSFEYYQMNLLDQK